MTKRRKTVRRSFLAAVVGASGLTLAACSDSGQHGNNAAATSEPASSDRDAG